MNSLYGAMGSPYFRYFNIEIAEGITTTGQLTNQWGERAANTWLNSMVGTSGKDFCIAGDTDSSYFTVADVVAKFKPTDTVSFLDQFCSKGMEPAIAKAFKELYEITNGYSFRVSMKREAIANRGIWTAKKRYILNLLNNEGVQFAEPKLKVVGIEAIKSSTPKVCRDELKKVFSIIMNGSEKELQDEVAKYKKMWFSLEPHRIAFPKNANDITSYSSKIDIYVSKTPIGARAALLYNWKLKQLGLDKQYRLIQNGDKMKFVYLKTPNPVVGTENVIGFSDKVPPELKLGDYIDYETQYTKAFVKPLEGILETIKWRLEPISSLEDFFA